MRGARSGSSYMIAFSARGAHARRVPAWIAASDDRVQGDAACGTALLATSSSEGENPASLTPGQDRSEGRRGDGERRAVF